MLDCTSDTSLTLQSFRTELLDFADEPTGHGLLTETACIRTAWCQTQMLNCMLYGRISALGDGSGAGSSCRVFWPTFPGMAGCIKSRHFRKLDMVNSPMHMSFSPVANLRWLAELPADFVVSKQHCGPVRLLQPGHALSSVQTYAILSADASKRWACGPEGQLHYG